MAVDHNNPQSRDEEILIATIDGKEYNKNPQSRIEELLLELKEVIEAGGGGGTSDYENLTNQPQVNGETLIGDKTGADLGLVDAEEGKDLSTNDYDDNEKAAVAAATSAISAMKDGSDIDSFGDVEVALLDKADISDLGTAAAKDSTNAVTSGSTDLVESGAVKDAIDSAVSKCYHHAGTKTVAQLTHDLLIAANEGNVYEITDSGTTTSDFMEGIGRPIKEGDNVGVARVSEGVYKFDLLSGFVDTSNFVQKSETAGLLKNDGTVDTTIQGDVSTLKSGLTNLDNEVNGDATTYPYADVITIPDAIPSNLADCSVKIEPVQSGSGDPSPENVRPISGHTEARVQRDGKNLCPVTKVNTLNSDTFKLNAGTYTISFKLAGSGMYSTSSVILRDDSNADVLSVGVGSASSGTVKNGQFTLQSEKTLRLYVNNITASTGGYYIEDIQIELGSTATPYEPYQGKTYTIALGDTIYGGTVRIDSNGNTVMDVDRADISISGGFNKVTSQEFDYSLGTKGKAFGLLTCDRCIRGTSASALIPFVMFLNQNGDLVVRTYEEYSTAGDFLTAIGGSVQAAYELATPFTVQLTPTQIQLLKGTNTLTASTGYISVTVNGVNGAIGALQSEVNELAEDVAEIKPLNYSTTEQKTGQKWIDGKDIYFKTVEFGALPNNAKKSVDSGLTGETIIKMYGIAKSGNDYTTLPSTATNAIYTVTLGYDAAEHQIDIYTATDMTSYSGFVVLEYTKETT